MRADGREGEEGATSRRGEKTVDWEGGQSAEKIGGHADCTEWSCRQIEEQINKANCRVERREDCRADRSGAVGRFKNR